MLLEDYRLSKAQVEGLWTFMWAKAKGKRKGGYYEEKADSAEFWRCTLIESETRLGRAARGIANSETEAAPSKPSSS